MISLKRKSIIGFSIIISLIISGCTNKNVDSFNVEKEKLTSEIIELQELISKKDEEINGLKDKISKITIEKNELIESLKMVRFSSYSRLTDYNDSFDNLKNVYNIDSKYTIRNDWYVINDDYFQIELLGYDDAKKVDFYALRMESGEDTILIFSDTDHSDGWVYKTDNISEIINKHVKRNPRGFSYRPYFVLYTEVTLKDGTTVITSKLPIYYEETAD